MKAKNVGAVTSIDASEGKSLISSEGKVTDRREFDDDKQFYFHEHRPTAKTGSEWNLKDEFRLAFPPFGFSQHFAVPVDPNHDVAITVGLSIAKDRGQSRPGDLHRRNRTEV